jgi:hypothetical protein
MERIEQTIQEYPSIGNLRRLISAVDSLYRISADAPIRRWVTISAAAAEDAGVTCMCALLARKLSAVSRLTKGQRGRVVLAQKRWSSHVRRKLMRHRLGAPCVHRMTSETHSNYPSNLAACFAFQDRTTETQIHYPIITVRTSAAGFALGARVTRNAIRINTGCIQLLPRLSQQKGKKEGKKKAR